MHFKLLITIFLVSMLCGACNERGEQVIKQSDKQQVSKETKTEQIRWIYSLSEGLKLSQEKNKPLMVEFYADWCGWCKKLDKDTYGDTDIIQLSNNFVCVKVNTDKNPEEAKKYKVNGLPTIVFLNSAGGIIEKVIGYRESKDFISIMKKVLET